MALEERSSELGLQQVLLCSSQGLGPHGDSTTCLAWMGRCMPGADSIKVAWLLAWGLSIAAAMCSPTVAAVLLSGVNRGHEEGGNGAGYQSKIIEIEGYITSLPATQG